MTPVNVEAEQALLGAILADNRTYERVADFLRAEHFASEAHRDIYGAIRLMRARGELANPITLKTYLDKQGALDAIGGVPYLVKLAASVPNIANAENYGRLVHDLYLRRELLDRARATILEIEAADPEQTSAELLATAQGRLSDLESENAIGREAISRARAGDEALRLAEAAYKADGALVGVPTGLSDLDRKSGGFHAGDLIFIGGRTGIGKSIFAATIAHACATNEQRPPAQRHVLYWSGEMPAHQLLLREFAAETGISVEKQRTGKFSSADFQALFQAHQRTKDLPIRYLDERLGSVAPLRQQARRMKRHGGLGVVIVDYLQLIGGGEGGLKRNEELAQITKAFKDLAIELSIPVVVLSQLGRQIDDRENKRPYLSDLSGSGAIENDADVVLFPFREEYYLKDAEPRKRPNEKDETFYGRKNQWAKDLEASRGLVEIIVAKNRNGSTYKIIAAFDGARSRMYDRDTQGEPEVSLL